MGEERQVWVWRYWQTEGIKEVVAAQWPNGAWQWNGCGASQAWCYTREQAVSVANARRLAKIASLKKQIAKLEKLKFE